MDIIKPVFPVIVPYIAAGMVRSVMYGMAWAMQEFAWIAVFEGISTCVYIPLCLYAKCKRRPLPLPSGATPAASYPRVN